ncbi:hypothetical protein [Methanosphaera sp.]
MDFNDKEKITKLLNVNEEEFKFIKDLNKRNLVFEAIIKDKIDDETLENKCILILQKSTLKIIKYLSNEDTWRGNTLIYYKSIDLINTVITDNLSYTTINIASTRILLEFSDKKLMFFLVFPLVLTYFLLL